MHFWSQHLQQYLLGWTWRIFPQTFFESLGNTVTKYSSKATYNTSVVLESDSTWQSVWKILFFGMCMIQDCPFNSPCIFYLCYIYYGNSAPTPILVIHSGQDPACWRKSCRFDAWVRKILWNSKWQPTPVFLPENFHGQRSLAGYSPQAAKSWTRLSNWAYHLKGKTWKPGME